MMTAHIPYNLRVNQSYRQTRMAKVALLVLVVSVASAQENGGFHAPWVSCFDSTGQFVGPKNLRTDPLMSADGKLRAYAEIRAAPGSESGCGNTVRLFASSNSRPYRLVFSQSPSVSSGTADSLGPVAWSPDNRWLAVEFGYWFYASDNASLGLLLYDGQTHAIRRPDVIGKIERRLGKKCSLGLRSVIGFDSRSRVVLRVSDWVDEVGDSSHCIRGTANWLYDPVTGATNPVAAPR
jgi:hypothetical protein